MKLFLKAAGAILVGVALLAAPGCFGSDDDPKKTKPNKSEVEKSDQKKTDPKKTDPKKTDPKKTD